MSTNDILFPLDFVYRHAGVEPPSARTINSDDIPLPYRPLLAHTSDMTVTLERHVGGPVMLRVLSTIQNGEWYLRRVLLVQQNSGRPVEMGAIRIHIGSMNEPVRQQILLNQVPLGRVLREGGVQFQSRPKIFLAVTPNSEMMGVFWMREPSTLYGRQTEMFVEQRKIGDIVEILPPVARDAT